MLRLAVGLGVLLVAVGAASQDGCVLPLQMDYTFFTPLIFSQDGTLLNTENVSETSEDLSISDGGTVIISCAPNYFKKYPTQKQFTAKCKSGTKLTIDGKDVDYTDLGCELRSIEEVLTPVTGCSKFSSEFGITNPIDQTAYILGEACYNREAGQTLFAHTKLRASGRSNLTDMSLRTGDIKHFTKNHPMLGYKSEFMRAARLDTLNPRLKVALKTKKIPALGIANILTEEFLPHKQFLPTLKLEWNYVMLNDEDSLEILDQVQQDISGLTGDNLELYVGTHGVLSLKDKDGKDVEIWMQDNRFPVPKFVWFVVKSGNKATALAVVNDPDASEQQLRGAAFCQDICSQISWLSKPNSGVICCELKKFRQTVTAMPELTDVRGLFK